jgi:hypothetical protein
MFVDPTDDDAANAALLISIESIRFAHDALKEISPLNEVFADSYPCCSWRRENHATVEKFYTPQ